MPRRRLPLPSMGRRGMAPSRNLALDGAIPSTPMARGSSLVDSGVYEGGHRIASPAEPTQRTSPTRSSRPSR